MKIAGVLVESLIKKAPQTFLGFCGTGTQKEGDTSEHIEGNPWDVRSTSLLCRKFRGDLEQIGFTFNVCNACTTNRSANEKTHTVRFHVDNLMSGHVDRKSMMNF